MYFNPDRHPKTVDHLRTFIAKNKLSFLILYFVLFEVVLSLILGWLFFSLERENNNNFLFWAIYSFNHLLGGSIAGNEVVFASQYSKFLYSLYLNFLFRLRY